MKNNKLIVSTIIALVGISVVVFLVLNKNTDQNNTNKNVPEETTVESNKLSDVPLEQKPVEKISNANVAVSYSEQISASANRMSKALINKDYSGFTNYVYPKLVEVMGGKELMSKTISEGLPEGFNISDVSIGVPSKVLHVGNQLQATVPDVTTIQMNGGTIVAKSTLIALSDDGGKTWFFLDTSNKNLTEVRALFPEVSTDLVLIKYDDPVFTKN